MTGPGGKSPPLRNVTLAIAASLRAAVWIGAIVALEAAARIYFDPSLSDSRLDALAFSVWGVAAGAGAGLGLGFLSGIVLAPALGATAAAAWSVLLLAFGRPLAALLDTLTGRTAAGWIAFVVGIAAASAVVFFAPTFTPADRGRGKRGGRLGWLVPIAAVALVLGISGARVAVARTKDSSGASPSLLLVTVDTLRADAIAAFREGRAVPPGLERARTPRLDKLASESVVFTQATTPLPKTPQAIASMMTGTYPGSHGLRDLFSALDRSSLTAAEVLRSEGWATRAVVTNLLVGRGSGIGQGFDRYHDKDGLRSQVKALAVVDMAARLAPSAVTWTLNRFPSLRSGREDATETTDRAIRELARLSGRPYFLWVHYLDPHWTYWAPQPYRDEADTAAEASFTLYDDVRRGSLPIGEMIHHNRMDPADVARVRSLYAGEVAYMDAQVGRLVDAALSLPQAGSTLVVFTADHGESLGEHDYFFSHGDLVDEPGMRVPLIVRLPGGKTRAIIGAPVSLVDVMPTFLELMGAPIPSRIQGRSLGPMIHGEMNAAYENSQNHMVFGESDLSYLGTNPWPTIPGEAGKLRSVWAGRYKLVRIPHDHDRARALDPELGSGSAGRVNAFGFEEATRLGGSSPDVVRLFDLASDPSELDDIAGKEPERTAEMGRALDAWLSTMAGRESAERSGSRELLEGLKSLGYVDPGKEKERP